MILLLDIGNTRIKWGTFSQGKLQPGRAMLRGGDAIATLLDKVEQRCGAPLRVMVSNVAGSDVIDPLNEQVAARWRSEVETVQTQSAAFGITNGYDEPQRLGVDRWLALIAARQMCDRALCVVDCGTALTVDLLDRQGGHLGGMIVPGVGLMQGALISNTDALTLESDRQAGKYPLFAARNTADGITGGVQYTLAALIDRVAVDAKVLIGEEAAVVLTGGDAAVLKPQLRCNPRFEPDLVLKGMVVVAEVDGR